MKHDKIALFDLEGTLADYDGQLLKDLHRLTSEYEPPPLLNSGIPYMEARRRVITSQMGWWLNLERFQLGWDVLEVAREIGYSIAVLTKGSSAMRSWVEKLEWCKRHLADHADDVAPLTFDKGLVKGAVLVDDWPDYIEIWLAYMPQGLVIMPAHDYNADFVHPNVVRYDGTNLDEVWTRMVIRIKDEP